MRLSFKEPATGIMEGIIELHNMILVYMVYILISVLWFIFAIKYNFTGEYSKSSAEGQILHETKLETIWTIVPAIILYLIAVPSFALLYMMEEGVSPKLTVKVLGYQWYWNYEYQPLFGNYIKYDSYMLSIDDLSEGDVRLLDVDNPLVLPERLSIRILVTAMDVLHCWAVPEFGVKVDAVPGRLNQVMLYLNRIGYFYGQCSELCGVNHGFMPISVAVVDISTFVNWSKI